MLDDRQKEITMLNNRRMNEKQVTFNEGNIVDYFSSWDINTTNNEKKTVYVNIVIGDDVENKNGLSEAVIQDHLMRETSSFDWQDIRELFFAEKVETANITDEILKRVEKIERELISTFQKY
jgi:L-rhamnose isomerase